MEKNQIINLLLNAIYWASFTQSQEEDVLEIIDTSDNPMDAANEICEYLDIEKRYNRQALNKVLSEYFSEFKKTS